VGSINDEPNSVSEACVTALDKGTEEGYIEVEFGDIKIEGVEIKLEQSECIKEENPDLRTILPIQPKPEVNVWGLYIGSNVSCFQEHLLPQIEKFFELHFNFPYVHSMHFVWFI